jgi:hypothetical protein
VQVTRYPREQLGKDNLASYIESHRFDLPQSKLGNVGWTMAHPSERALLDKLRERGVPLSEYSGIKPYYGIKTGCNEAFLIDQATKDRLCCEDPRSAQVLKKYLRGRDVSRWSSPWDGNWMIFARRGVEIERYPAIKSHLERFRPQLEPRPRSFGGNDWLGRKPGAYKWYEIQDSVDYFPLFEAPKIVYQVIQSHPRYAIDGDGLYTNDKAFLLPTGAPWLLAVLNSPAMWWHNWRYLVHMIGEALTPAGDKMIHVPVPRPTDQQSDQANDTVQRIVDLTRNVNEAVAATLDVLRVEWAVDAPSQALSAFDSLASDAFVGEVKKRRRKDAGRLSPRALLELRKLFEAEAQSLIEKRAEILGLESVLADLVHAAWGLDAGDIAVLRETAPPRMPPGW